MRRVTMAAFAVLALAAGGELARACSCDDTKRSADELRTMYEAILIGEVVRIDLVEHCSQYSDDGRVACYDEKDVTLRVWKSWRGVDTPFVVARTGGDDADCGYDFKVGGRYVVFAHLGSETALRVSRCYSTVNEYGQALLIGSLGQPLQTFSHQVGNERW